MIAWTSSSSRDAVSTSLRPKRPRNRPRLPETSRVDGANPPRHRRAAQEELVQSMFDTFDADLVDLKMKYRDRIADFAVHPIMEIYLGRQTMDG